MPRISALSVSKKAYAKAGVDVDLGNSVKSGIQQLVGGTFRPEVLGKVGGFGGLFRADFKAYKDPILVSSMDGVGTKLKVAELVGKHDTIGEDLVNHCVNDIAVVGAEPLFFLDYIGTGKLEPAKFRQILRGLTKACTAARCALIGGETAQMPGLYRGGDYDLVGTIVGIVDRAKMIDGSQITPGDVILGLPSSGLHTNGYSLARKILFQQLKLKVDQVVHPLKKPVGQELLQVHRSYLPEIKKLRAKLTIKGLAHITGGGLVDNLPRILPAGVDAAIELGSWTVPPIFQFLRSAARLPNEELYQVFNMGIGMVIIVGARDATAVRTLTKAVPIGRIIAGSKRVRLVEKK